MRILVLVGVVLSSGCAERALPYEAPDVVDFGPADAGVADLSRPIDLAPPPDFAVVDLRPAVDLISAQDLAPPVDLAPPPPDLSPPPDLTELPDMTPNLPFPWVDNCQVKVPGNDGNGSAKYYCEQGPKFWCIVIGGSTIPMPCYRDNTSDAQAVMLGNSYTYFVDGEGVADCGKCPAE